MTPRELLESEYRRQVRMVESFHEAVWTDIENRDPKNAGKECGRLSEEIKKLAALAGRMGQKT